MGTRSGALAVPMLFWMSGIDVRLADHRVIVEQLNFHAACPDALLVGTGVIVVQRRFSIASQIHLRL